MSQKDNRKILKIIIILSICTIGVLIGIYENTNKKIHTQSTNETIENVNSQNFIASKQPNIVLYEGIEIHTEPGVQNIADMIITEDSMKKYNTTYYNYENGVYQGTSNGTFGEETYEGVSVVQGVKRLAMTQNNNAIPRTYQEKTILPEQLKTIVDCENAKAHAIDLDADKQEEYIVCYVKDEEQASSGIVLLDTNFHKIADLVLLENGYWSGIQQVENKVLLSLNNIEYIDLDQDNIMEMIIKIPNYEGTKISIVKYANGKLEGQVSIKASLLP